MSTAHTLVVSPGDDLPEIEIEHDDCELATGWDGMILSRPGCPVEGMVFCHGLEAYVPWTLLPYGRYRLRYWIADAGTEREDRGIDLVPADQESLREIVAVATRAGHPPVLAGTDHDGELFIEWPFDTSRRTW